MASLHSKKSSCSFSFRVGALSASAALLALPCPQALAGITGRTLVASGLNAPMFTAQAPGDPTRLYIAERSTPGNSTSATAAIRILDLTTGTLQATPFLSIPGIDNRGEGGLLGHAFHPDYQTNGKFYTYVTAPPGGVSFTSYIREYTRSATNPNLANAASTPVLQFTQTPQTNHKGGWIGFSPNDGYLYMMSGDGGGGNDQGTGHTEPDGNAQDISSNFFGKVLRIDVNGDDFNDPDDPNHGLRNYAIPPTNPFADTVDGMGNPVIVTGDDEIWAYGLRNPFRAGFDRATGDLWIGDVGEGRREEIDFQLAGSSGGENYGWRFREGLIATPGVGGPKPAGAVDPVWDYKQPSSPNLTPADTGFTGQAVVGGVPYRGPDPTLQGVYFFADTISNQIWTLRLPHGAQPLDVDNVTLQLPTNSGSPNSPVAISEDAVGNLYITYLSGSVYRINTDTFTPGDFNGDASVDELDLAIWKTGFGMTGVTRTSGDADADGDVDGGDFLVWQQNLGWSALNAATPTSTPTPEPASAVLIAMGALALSKKRASSHR